MPAPSALSGPGSGHSVTSVAGDMGRMWWEDLTAEVPGKGGPWPSSSPTSSSSEASLVVCHDATLAIQVGGYRPQRHSLGAGLGNLLRPFNMSAERGALTTVLRDGGGGRTCGLLRRQGSHPTRRPSEAQARSAGEATRTSGDCEVARVSLDASVD